MPAIDPALASDEELLSKALQDCSQKQIWAEVDRRFREPLLRKTRAGRGTLPRLPDDLCEDVVQATFMKLVDGTARFDPERGAAGRFLEMVRLNADRGVRREWGYWATPTAGIRVLATRLLSESVSDDGMMTVADSLPAEFDALEQLIDEDEALSILRRAHSLAPDDVGAALRLIYYEDLSLRSAAEAIGLDRSTLTRRIRRWFEAVPVR